MKIDFRMVDVLKEAISEKDARNFVSLIDEKIEMAYQDKLATKKDVAALKEDVTVLKEDVAELKSELKLEIANSSKSLLKWLIGLLVPLYAAFAALAITLLNKFL